MKKKCISPAFNRRAKCVVTCRLSLSVVILIINNNKAKLRAPYLTLNHDKSHEHMLHFSISEVIVGSFSRARRVISPNEVIQEFQFRRNARLISDIA